MKHYCLVCKTDLTPAFGQLPPCSASYVICPACSLKMTKSDTSITRALVEAIDAPVLLMQSEPRQVHTANQKALALFGKILCEVEGHRGGEVFDCINSFTEAGCGKDKNCKDCKIKEAVIETLTTGQSFQKVSNQLEIKKANNTNTFDMQVSTERVGEFALLRIDQYGRI